MADNVSNVTLNVSDKGTLEVLTKAANKLRKELEGAQKAAGGVRTPTPVAAARAAVSRESGLARSVGEGGGTGSGSRDFARQAEGLGGLVRIYATFAANIFAVSAAFTALSRAADTANLVKGLDQLGAASGRNLGSLAKQLVEATDGAISLREALTATSQASSGGLSNANILKLGQIAKQASQALGIDMVNAVSRLSRGITKLEPELLDEIGIFVRVDKASADYARSIGKSASALTDFEKRQAFANAVLEQGAAKFGAINLDVNPYSKIQASLENLSFTALNLVNKVFTPLLNILSSNPVALGAVIAGIANVLIRQAIPAIGQYRERLAASAKEARELVVQTNALRKEQKYAKESSEGIAIADRLKSAKLAAEAAEKEAEALRQSKAIRGTIAKLIPNASTAGEEQLIKLKKLQLKLEDDISKTGVSPAILARRNTELDLVNKTAKAIQIRMHAELEADKIDERVSNNRLARFVSQEAAQDRLANSAAAKSQRVNILNNISAQQPTLGVVGSFKELNKQVVLARRGLDAAGDAFDNNQKKMSALNGAYTRVIGGAQILGSALGTLVSSLGQFAIIATAVIAAGQFLYSVFSKAEKEADAFAKASDEVVSALDNVDKTLEFINKKRGAEVISVQSINAQASALSGLSESLIKVSEDFQKLISARGGLEFAVDKVFDFFGKGDSDKLAANVAKSVEKSIAAIPVGPAREIAKQKISSILDIKDISAKSIDKALDSLSDDEAASKARTIANILSEISKESMLAAGNLASLDSNFKESSKLVNDLNNSLKFNDTQGKLGANLINDSFELTKVLKDPIKGVTMLKNVISDVNLLSILPPDFAGAMAAAATEIEKVAAAAGDADKNLSNAETRLRELQAKGGTRSTSGRSGVGAKQTDFGRDIAAAEAAVKEAIALQATAKADAAKLTARFSDLGTTFFKAGIDKLNVSLKGAFEEGAIIAARGYLSVLKEAGGNTAKQEGALAQQQINVQVKLIEANFAQAESAKKLQLTMQEANALARLAAAKQAQREAGASDTRGSKAADEINAANKELDVLREARRLVDNKSLKGFEAAGTDKNNPVLQEAANSVKDFFILLFGKEGQLAKLYGQAAAERIQNKGKVAVEGIDSEKRKIDASIGILNAEQKILDVRKSTLETVSSEVLALEEKVQLKQLEAKFEKELLDNSKKSTLSKIALGEKPNDPEAKAALAKAEEERAVIIRNKEAEIVQLKVANIDKVAAAQKAALAESYSLQDRLTAADAAITTQQIESDELALRLREELGTVSQESLAIKKAGLEIEKISIDNNLKLVQIDRERAAVEAKYQTAVSKAAAINDSQGRAAALADAERVRGDGLATLSAERAAVDAIFKSRMQNVEATKTNTLEIIKQNKSLQDQEDIVKSTANFADSLSKVFGDIGDVLGKTLVGLAETSKERKILDDKAAKDRKAYANDDIQLAKIEKKYKEDSLNLELTSLASVAGGVKSLFKEKTAAYKTFATIEKAIHIARLASMAQEAAVALSTQGTVIASNLAKAASSGISAITAAFAAPFPVGFVAGAAMIAIISSILGKSVGRGASQPKGFSAEEQQKVQGTGQMYQGGQLVNRGGGALGDNTAVADSLNNGISKIEEHTFSSLEYSNKMLDNLKGIKKNTEGLSALILQSGLNVKGINPDSTVEFGTSGVQVQNADFANKAIEPIFNALGLSKTSGIGQLAGKISTAIFGGKKTVELQDIGIAFEGSLSKIVDQLKMGGQDLDVLYQNIKTTTSGGWFRSSKTSFETELSTLDKMQAEAFGNIFAGIGDTVRSAAEALGKNSKLVEDSISAFNVVFKTSFKDLKPEELTKALEAEFSVTFNQLAEKVLPEFQKFRKAGEEFGDTIIRLARDVQVVSFAAESAGLSVGDISKYAVSGESVQETVVRVTETFIDAAGGLDNLVTKTQFYVDNFLTDAERLAPVQARLTAELERLGLASVDTVDEFKNAVKAAVALGPAGASLYASLLNVAEAFDMVYNKEKDAKEKESKIASIEKEILDTLGFSYNALLISREQELKDLTDSEKALKKYLYVQQDLMKTQSIMLEIMELESSATEVLQYRRTQELKALSTGDQLLKIRLYRLQDEKKLLETSNNQKIKILELLGDKEEVLNIKRKAELETLDAQLVPTQMYIYALEDEASLRDELNDSYKKQNTSLKEIISSTRSAIKSLKDYRESLLQSDLSILNPAQKYAKAKQEALDLARIATSVATTEIERIAKDDAISKLPGATSAWLEASRVLYASSEAYTSDFKTVMTILDNTESALTAQLSDAEKQQKLIEDTNNYLDSINGSTRTTAEILQLLYEAQTRTAEAKMDLPTTAAVAKNSFATAAVGPSGVLGAGDTMITGTAGYVGTLADTARKIKEYIDAGGSILELRNKFVSEGVTSQMVDSIMGYEPGTALRYVLERGIPAFKMGGTANGLSLVGEQGPELVNFSNPARVYSNNQTDSILNNGALIKEIVALRSEVSQLRAEQKQQTGDLIKTNYDATIKAANEIANSNEEASKQSGWDNKVAFKLA